MSHKSVRLFFQEGSSDKVYHAHILDDGGAYTVQVEWGRRGSKLNQGNKALRVSLAEAQKVFDKLVREKTDKGYQAISDEIQPAAVVPPDGQGSGSKVPRRARVGRVAQLLNPIEADALDAFVDDDRWIGQQKLDGVRVLGHVHDGELIGTNRAGQKTEVASALLEGLGYLPIGTVVDGEVVSHDDGESIYWLFDVLQVGDRDVTGLGYEERWTILEEELEPALSGPIRVLPVAGDAKQKRALHDRLFKAGAEGVVFKDRHAPYSAGRPSSGGTQRKLKFVKTADVILTSNAGNAYAMAVYDGKKKVDIGKVFAGTTNQSRKRIDALLSDAKNPVAEVRYLYATDDDQLFQPVFVRLRDDKEPTSCLRSQLTHTRR